jgi:hypothetical protein
VTVEKHASVDGDVYVIGFQGLLRNVRDGIGVGLLVAENRTDGDITVTTRMDGINYYGMETLNLNLGFGNDILNVQGTTAETNVELNDGGVLGDPELVFVSSDADLDPRLQINSDAATRANPDAAGPFAFDYLRGNLDTLSGDLNIDAGAGRHGLWVSDAQSETADTAAAMATATPINGLDLEVELTGLTDGDIRFGATENAVDGHFAEGMTVWDRPRRRYHHCGRHPSS